MPKGGRGCFQEHPRHIMIELTRINGEVFLLNVFLIEEIQSFSDTTITLTNGRKIIVKTGYEEISKKILNYYQQIGLIGIENRQVTK